MVGLLLLRRYDAEQLSPLSCPHNKTGITLVITADLAMNWDCDWRLIRTMNLAWNIPFSLSIDARHDIKAVDDLFKDDDDDDLLD